MTYKVLSLKWRPKIFDEVIGQKHVTVTLSNAIKLGRIAHAFTFSGPRGVGKTTTARILAQTLNQVKNISDSFDIIEMDAASNRGIDEIRNINENVNYAPSHGKYKVYIIDEVHMLTKEAFNALLKTLEEPPEHVVFILCTTESHKMPATILSRTQRYDFKRISVENITKQLEYILKKEKISYDLNCLNIISDRAGGSMRDAISLLDQMICLCENNLSLEVMKKYLGVFEDEKCLELLNLIGKRDSSKIFLLLNKVFSSGISIEEFVNSFNKFLINVITSISMKNNSFNVEIKEIDLLRIIDIMLKFQSSMKGHSQPKIALEVLMLKLSYLDKMVDITEFINNNNIVDGDDKSNLDEKNKKDKVESSISVTKIDDSKSVKENISDVKEIAVKNNLKQNKIVKSIISEDILKNWPKIIKNIEKVNSKTANFLIDSVVESFDENKIKIKINNVSGFAFKGLVNDIPLIEKSLYDCLNCKIKVELLEGELSKNEKKKSNENEKDHPLFMDVLNKFKGEVLR